MATPYEVAWPLSPPERSRTAPPPSATPTPASEPEHLDVVIVGAGLSGIGMACHLLTAFPALRLVLLEARSDLGGTWDLFRYPGVRSDSDMFTLGYRFRPWRGVSSIAEGGSVLTYLRQVAAEYAVDERIRYHRRVVRAEWSTPERCWRLVVTRAGDGSTETVTCRFLVGCTGYYSYEQGYFPELPGAADFTGRVVHPQSWPADLDHTDLRVVVVGSGATAVTLVPALAERARQVTMLQRSPSYVVSQPATDPLADRLQGSLPHLLAARLVRARNLVKHIGFYELCRRRPRLARWLIRRWLTRQLPADFDVATHFSPTYDPWDQRLCLSPDGDLFRAIRAGRADIVTDRIERLTSGGIRLQSGRHLDADLVVSATGLQLLPLGGISLVVDGAEVSLPETMAYKGMMLSDVPNFGFVVGYTNASWTLKADLVSEYVVRLLGHMKQTGASICTPRRDPSVGATPFLDFRAGYVLRDLHRFPQQGDRAPWRLAMNYFVDRRALRRGQVDDGVMVFTGATVAESLNNVSEAGSIGSQRLGGIAASRAEAIRPASE